MTLLSQARTNAGAARRRRGFTVVELLIAGTLIVLLLAIVAGLTHLDHLVWQDGTVDFTNQRNVELCLERMASTVRTARSVASTSTSSVLTLQAPSYDASGNLVAPLQNGHVYSFYLSDTSGNALSSGSILWRAVDGVPDSRWSLTGGEGRVVLSGLAFSYSPAVNPTTVTVTATATLGVGIPGTADQANTSTRHFSSTRQFVLRNFGL